jgi:anti-sigma factor RsiW
VEYPTGWTCEVTVVKLELYLLGTLTLAEALAVAEHVEACANCAQCLVLWQPAGRRG